MNSEIFRVGQTYSFMGYDWTACELINKGKTLVIQSHGVTHGEWPGFVMPQFENVITIPNPLMAKISVPMTTR